MKNKRKPIKTTKRNIIDYWIQYIDECGMNFDWAEADTICWRCGCERKLQRCHIIPDSLGGKDEPSNFVLLCAECHQEAPNVEDKQFMWDWIKSFYSPFYNTFWQTRAFEEYKRIYKKSYSDELKDRNITTDHALIEFRNLKHGRTSYHFGHPFGNVATITGNYKMILDAFDQKYPSGKYKTDEEIKLEKDFEKLTTAQHGEAIGILPKGGSIIGSSTNSNLFNYKIVNEYVDNGYSGILNSRPELDKMIRDITLGKINMLIVKDMSRLTRDKNLTSYFTDIFFPDNDVRLISVTEYVDTGERYEIDDAVALRGIVNQSYLEDISKKIKAVKTNLKKQGKFIESSVAYGYKKEKAFKEREEG